MKKRAISVACIALSAITLCSCGKPSASSDTVQRIRSLIPGDDTQTEQPTPIPDFEQDSNDNQTETPECDKHSQIEITVDGHKIAAFGLYCKPISGVQRRFVPPKSRSGKYTVEYIHTPYGVDKDETLDYTLQINDDHTFEMSVVANGVKAEHYGRWYARRDSLSMYYDEEIDPTAHNVYVCDSLYAELMDNRIMFYDNGSTIVLARVEDDMTEEQQLRKADGTDSDTDQKRVRGDHGFALFHHKKLA